MTLPYENYGLNFYDPPFSMVQFLMIHPFEGLKKTLPLSTPPPPRKFLKSPLIPTVRACSYGQKLSRLTRKRFD